MIRPLQFLMRPTRKHLPDSRYKIWNTDWKYLIILDACRYDYFEKIYEEYLPEGELERVWSCGGHTLEWAMKCFKQYYDDVIYISTNPYINSKGLIPKFDARKHFYKIIEVWDWGWNKKLMTVHPAIVNKTVLEVIKAYPNKRLIIHYLQPHYPYLGLPPIKVKRRHTLLDRIKGFIRWRAAQLFGDKAFEMTIKLVGHYQEPLYTLAKEAGNETLRRAYERNLRIVLGYVAALLKHLHGKIVITADHGELLGEKGIYGHGFYLRYPELRVVPWLQIIKASKHTYKNIMLKQKIKRAQLNFRLHKLKFRLYKRP